MIHCHLMISSTRSPHHLLLVRRRRKKALLLHPSISDNLLHLLSRLMPSTNFSRLRSLVERMHSICHRLLPFWFNPWMLLKSIATSLDVRGTYWRGANDRDVLSTSPSPKTAPGGEGIKIRPQNHRNGAAHTTAETIILPSIEGIAKLPSCWKRNKIVWRI